LIADEARSAESDRNKLNSASVKVEELAPKSEPMTFESPILDENLFQSPKEANDDKKRKEYSSSSISSPFAFKAVNAAIEPCTPLTSIVVTGRRLSKSSGTITVCFSLNFYPF
jgi:hypothetical protein